MDRYLVIMVVNITIAMINLGLSIMTLVKSKCRLSIVAILIISTFTYSFTVKAFSDAMRYYQIQVSSVASILTSFSDRLNVFGMIYLSILVHEVQIKLNSRSA